MGRFRWGIFGTGAISAKFVSGLTFAQGAQADFVASRSLVTAQRLAGEFGIARAIEGYAEAARQGGVDAVYIASPPAHHAAHALLCLEAGLSVLVEKPFATSERDARRIAEAARSRSLFAMEAMWTRFLPTMRALREAVEWRKVGEVRFVTGNFGSSHRVEPGNGMFDPALGGGAMAHLGSYPVSLGQWLFGSPDLIQATGTVGPTGVEEDAAFQLRYPQGVTGSFLTSLRAWAPDSFHVLGDHGMIGIRGSIVRPYGLNITEEPPLPTQPVQFGWKSRLRQNSLVHLVAQLTNRSSRGAGKRYDYRYAGNGYQYEADEVRACIRRGEIESAVMPLVDSIAVASTIDRIRVDIFAQSNRDKDFA